MKIKNKIGPKCEPWETLEGSEHSYAVLKRYFNNQYNITEIKWLPWEERFTKSKGV